MYVSQIEFVQFAVRPSRDSGFSKPSVAIVRWGVWFLGTIRHDVSHGRFLKANS